MPSLTLRDSATKAGYVRKKRLACASIDRETLLPGKALLVVECELIVDNMFFGCSRKGYWGLAQVMSKRREKT